MNGKHIAFILLLLTLSGCNFFSFTASPSDAEDYIAQGRIKLNDGDYAGALADFADAVNSDPECSEARFLHAKATLLNTGFNVLNVVRELADTTRTDAMTLPFFDWEMDPANSMYQANLVIHDDLQPILENDTHGPIVRDDVKFDYAIALLIESMLSLRDTDLDGDIDGDDFNLSIFFDGDLDGFTIENFLDFWNNSDLSDADRAGLVNGFIDHTLELIYVIQGTAGLFTGEGSLFEDSEDSPYNSDGLDSLTTEMSGFVGNFYISDGEDNDSDWRDTNGNGSPDPIEWTDLNGDGYISDADGNPLPWFYSGSYTGEFTGGDWGVDEEIIDGLDNDGDFMVDEDAHY